MNKIFLRFGIVLAALSLQYCTVEKDTTFLIGEEQVGPLAEGTKVSAIETVFQSDSIVRDTTPKVLGSSRSKFKIFEKGGTHLLTLTASTDSLEYIENVQIHDPRYMTAEGIGIQSTFKDVKEAYEIRKVVTSMNNLVIFVKNSDLYFTISKDQLPGSLRYNSSLNIEAVQIPDKAQLKYIMVGW